MIKRKHTQQVKVGDVKIGGGAPVSIQSMTKVPTSNARAIIAQIHELERAGCEIVRVAVKSPEDAAAIRMIRRKISIPLVADIHFDHRLALASIAAGADKIRINPGNMRDKLGLAQVVRAAKKAAIPIRVGVNSGSVLQGERHRSHDAVVDDLVTTALASVRLVESLDFRDIVVSLKASDVVSTVEAYRRFSERSDHPLHLGVTAAGSADVGTVRSAIGIGALLVDGIGDTIRVSLTADPVEEVIAARRILEAVGARRFGVNVISCPTCGRCQVDLAKIVREVERRLALEVRSTCLPCTTRYSRVQDEPAGPVPIWYRAGRRYDVRARSVTVAIMGCEVNGPGESMDADIGIAAGKGAGALFVKGKIVKRVKEKDFVRELMKALKGVTSN